jgi:release factor glutamine methyltransferase
MEIPDKPQPWTILSLIEWGSTYLADKGFVSPRLNVELLLAHTLQCERIHLYTNFDKPPTQEELTVFTSYLQRRAHHEPLDYILGESEFMGLKFFVNNNVLIPRPETEVLVEQVIHHCRQDSSRVFRMVDIGTGSGNIAVSVAKFLSNVEIDALDIDEKALDVARNNAQRNEVARKINFLQMNILNDPLDCHTIYDIIVSNPPYISRAEFSTLEPEVREFEPRIATTDEADGLVFFQRIAEVGERLLKNGGWVFVEIGYNQSESVSKIFLNSGYHNIELVPDFNRIPRVMKAKKT